MGKKIKCARFLNELQKSRIEVKAHKGFWKKQYKLYMAGIRDIAMHDSTLAIMCALENEDI